MTVPNQFQELIKQASLNKSQYRPSVGKLLPFVCVFLLFSSGIYAQVSGTVYQDFNANGALDTGGAAYNDAPYEGATITAYDLNGNSVGTAISDATGNYTIGAVSGALRIEFTYPNNAGMMDGASGGTTVQFITAPASNINCGLSYAGAYCQDNPYLMTPCYISGDQLDDRDVMVRWSYNNSGEGPDDKTKLSEAQQLGATWGVAYDNTTEMLFTSAVLKRHVGLNEPQGLDAVYIIDPFSGSPNATPWLELTDDLGLDVGQALVGTNAARGLPNTGPSHDNDAFGLVGKVGIGDIEISDDMATLYIMNLYLKEVYEIDIATRTRTNTYSFSQTCTDGEFRPWALKYHKGVLYAGGVCDASANGTDVSDYNDFTGVDDLEAYVFELTGGAFVNIHSVPLDYAKQKAQGISSNTCADAHGWYPWADVATSSCGTAGGGSTTPVLSYPQPILSDIEFDVNDDLILGFLDRSGFQYGAVNYLPGTSTATYTHVAGGDILRACFNGTGWDNESPGSPCSTTVRDNLSAPGREEWYFGDFFDSNTDHNFISHPEIVIGGLALVPGLNEVASTAFDPINYGPFFGKGGVIFLDNTSGDYADGFELYANGSANAGPFGKSAGLGDLEALCEPAPIEIGNRVWWDMDSGIAAHNLNGVQDVGEPPIPGIIIELWIDPDGNTAGNNPQNGDEILVATTTTDATGRYLFSFDGNTNSPMTETWIAGNDRVLSDTNYQIRIPDWDGSAPSANSNATTLDAFLVGQGYDTGSIQMAPANSGSGSTAVIIDSDGVNNTGNSISSVSTGLAGENDHSRDFGFGGGMTPRQEDYPDFEDPNNPCGDLPCHTVSTDIYFGSGVTNDNAGSGDSSASSDTDDGVFISPDFDAAPGNTIRFPATVYNNTGNDAYIRAWIDWNGDGDFEDAGEQVYDSINSGTGTYTVIVPVVVPLNVTLNEELATRWRVSTDDANTAGPCGTGTCAADGEIEDYLLRFNCPTQICPEVGINVRNN